MPSSFVIVGMDDTHTHIHTHNVDALVVVATLSSSINRLRFVIKQLFWHGRNLGTFVCIYKAICFVLRRLGVRGGIESWIAGLVGGWYGFGESKVFVALKQASKQASSRHDRVESAIGLPVVLWY
jgi:hypothetical protein